MGGLRADTHATHHAYHQREYSLIGRRHYRSRRESVGGPIDVAIISRIDGFVWVSRKHYFEP
ncbi:MAG TPA: hypothetical protein VH209_02075, partial [Steroidobacteraceae bacterium]|nr:hypothetical protein [Steroidobacteraceae bacterium]